MSVDFTLSISVFGNEVVEPLGEVCEMSRSGNKRENFRTCEANRSLNRVPISDCLPNGGFLKYIYRFFIFMNNGAP